MRGPRWRHLIEEEGLRPDAVVLTEPSELKVARGQKGKVQMVVRRGACRATAAPPASA